MIINHVNLAQFIFKIKIFILKNIQSVIKLYKIIKKEFISQSNYLFKSESDSE